jgi:glycosyltransferase involved in cell wall biosynthesis
LTDRVVSASQFSFPFKTNKLIPIGHGINSTLFNQSLENKKIKYISVVGRISLVKNIDLIIKAYSKLNHKKYKLVIIGDTVTKEDINYKKKLIKIISKKNLQNLVEFKKSLNRDELSKVYNDSLCLINATKFGSFDKVVLEAMICGTPALSHNIAFKDLYIPYEEYCIFKYNDEIDLSEKLNNFIEIESEKLLEIKKTLYNNTITNHSLTTINSRLESVFNMI